MTKRIELDEKTKKALLGALPFSTEGEHEYTPPFFERKDEHGTLYIPQDYHPRFYLASMTTKAKEKANLILRDIKKPDGFEKREKDVHQTVADHLIRWENLIDVGTDTVIDHVANEAGRTELEEVYKLPPTTVGALFYEILKISGLIHLDKLSLGS